MDPKFDTFERIIFPSFMDMPKVYRDDAVESFWNFTSPLGNRKEIFFIQGSPGCGKSYTLRDIGRVPQQQEKYSHYLCVGISFNSVTEINDMEVRLAEQYPDYAGPIFAIPRLIFSLFVKDITWLSFFSAFSSAFSVYGMISIMNNDVIQLLKARKKNNNFEIILLADVDMHD